MMMVDQPMFEQLAFAPSTNIAGSNIVDDGERFIYFHAQSTSAASTFWRFDTWSNVWQQLANPTLAAGTVANMFYTTAMGSQLNGTVNGAIYLFKGNGTTCGLYKYDISLNAWTTLSITGVPATFATDCYLMYPSVGRNNYETAYHAGVTRTITTTANALAGATTVSVSATAEAMAIGTALRFGAYDITVTAEALKGATSLTVSGATEAMKAGSIFKTRDGKEICLSADSLAGATTLSVQPLLQKLLVNTKVKIEKFAVLTVAAALGATSLTVTALRVGIPSGSTAGYYGNAYLVGNNATVMYRYNIGAGAWYTTSANSGNPAIPAVTGTVGTGCALKWLPADAPDKLWCIRGNATSSIYQYDLVTNTWSTLTYYPSTETFTTGTMVASRDVGGKQATLFIQKDATMRVFEFVPYRNTMQTALFQNLYPTSTALVGDKSCTMTSPDGVEFFYIMLHNTTAFLRCALLDS